MSKHSVHFSSKTDLWGTPQALFDVLNRRFAFTLDVCATPQNAKCARFFTPEQDGLKQNWGGERCWMNPPYGRDIADWVSKAREESIMSGALVVGLLPARLDSHWWNDHVQGYADTRHFHGRIKFGGHKNSAPFPSALAVWWGQLDIQLKHWNQPFCGVGAV